MTEDMISFERRIGTLDGVSCSMAAKFDCTGIMAL
jgi:hypothetical protein